MIMENDKMSKDNHWSQYKLFVLLGVLFILSITILLFSPSKRFITSLFDNNQQWTLFIYANGRSDTPTTVIPNYDSQRMCVEKGVQLMSLPENRGEKALFTCGLNCKMEYGVNVCNRICYKDGTCRE